MAWWDKNEKSLAEQAVDPIQNLNRRTEETPTISLANPISIEFLTINVSIGGREHTIKLAEALTFSLGIENLTDQELDLALEACSIHRVSILLAAEEVSLSLRKKKRELLTWEAEKHDSVREKLIARRLVIEMRKGRDKPGAETFRVTERDMDLAFSIDSELGSEWKTRKEELDELESLERKYRGIEEILKDRGYLLMSLGKRRLSQRAGQDLRVNKE